MVKVSVIVPVYQAEKYIRKSVQSIIDQTYNNLEIVLVDDGSSDGSLSICNELCKVDSRIKLIHQENQGVSAARNKGLMEAQGDYILFVDSDDLIDSYMIQYMVEKAISSHSEIVMCGFDYIYQNRTEIQIPSTEEGKYNKKAFFSNFWQYYRDGILHNIGTKLYSKKLLDKNNIRFDEQRNVLEDIQFCVEAISSAEYVYICKKNFYKYLMEVNQHSIQKTYRKNFYVNLEKLFHFIESLGIEKNKVFFLIYMDAILLTLINEFYGSKKKVSDIIKQYKYICNLDYVKESKKYITSNDVRFSKYFFYLNIWKSRVYILYFLVYMWYRGTN